MGSIVASGNSNSYTDGKVGIIIGQDAITVHQIRIIGKVKPEWIEENTPK
jgi:hypothetical protein